MATCVEMEENPSWLNTTKDRMEGNDSQSNYSDNQNERVAIKCVATLVLVCMVGNQADNSVSLFQRTFNQNTFLSKPLGCGVVILPLFWIRRNPGVAGSELALRSRGCPSSGILFDYFRQRWGRPKRISSRLFDLPFQVTADWCTVTCGASRMLNESSVCWMVISRIYFFRK